jgi:hypothetical protein
MRIIVPYTELSQGTARCLDRLAPQAERIYVGDSPTRYWEVLRDAWADGESFILIEHDLEFDDKALSALEACPRPVCTVAGWFRLTRFRSEMMRAIPDVFESLRPSERHWIPMEWQARTRMERAGFGLHSHIGEADVANPTRGLLGTEYRGLYTSADRRPVWFEWLRTLPASAADEFTARAWAEVTDDGRACRLPACKRRGVAAFPSICDRCRD